MTVKSIVIEWRNPRTKEEKELWGETFVYHDIATVFINLKKNRKSKEAVDTFFHEIAHVFFGFHTKNKKMSDAKEEELAMQVGKLVSGLIE